MKQHSANRQNSIAINIIRRCIAVAGIVAIASASAWQLPRNTQEAQEVQKPPTHRIKWKTSSLTFDRGRIINVHNTVVLNDWQPDLVTDTVVITGVDSPLALGRIASRDDNIQHLPVALSARDYTITRTATADGTPMTVIALNRIHFRPTDVNGGFEVGVFDATDPKIWVQITNGDAEGDTLRIRYANAIPRVALSHTGVIFRGGDLGTGVEAARELDDGAVTITVHSAERNLQLARVVDGDNNIDPNGDFQPRIHYDTDIGRNTTTFTLRRVVFRPTATNGGFSIGVFATDTTPHWTQITNGPSYGKDTFRVTFREASEWVACTPARPLAEHEKADFLSAASTGNIDGVSRYLSPCVREVDASDSQGHTALILAAANNHVKIVELLIAAGANLEIKDTRFGATALVHAINRGDSHIATVQLLLDADADVNTATAQGNTPLIRAVESNHTALMNAILATGRANPNHRNKGGDTAVMVATQNGLNEIVLTLLKAGANPDIRSYGGPDSHKGFTPLMWAAYYNNTVLIDILGLNGANLELTDNVDGRTAFLWAAARGHTNSLKYLKTLGANIHHLSKYGSTAYNVAYAAGKRATAAWLFAQGVHIFFRSSP